MMIYFIFYAWRAYRAKAEVQLMEGRTDEHDRLLFVAWSCMLLNLDNFVIIYNTVVVIGMYPYNSYNILQFCTSKKRYK